MTLPNDDSVSRSVAGADDEEMLLQTDDPTESQEVVTSASVFNMESLMSSITSSLDAQDQNACLTLSRPPVSNNIIDFNQAILLDMQMIYHLGYGALIKEIAYRVWNDTNVRCMNFRHYWTDVPVHLVSEYKNQHYDVYTGMCLQEGEYVYDDSIIASMLSDVRIVFLKGANKKTALSNVYKRLLKDATQKETNNTGGEAIIPREPIIINVDASTADDEDRLLCKENNISMADFSFPFVYANMGVYINMLYDIPYATTDTLYFTNVVSKDPRYNLAGRGRVVCICQNDHSSGGRIKNFGMKQRCSLMNLSILDTLWFKGRDTLFRQLIQEERAKRERRKRNTQIQQRHQEATLQRNDIEQSLTAHRWPKAEQRQHNNNKYRQYPALVYKRRWQPPNQEYWYGKGPSQKQRPPRQRAWRPWYEHDVRFPHSVRDYINNQKSVNRFLNKYESYDMSQHDFVPAIRNNRPHCKRAREDIHSSRVYKRNRDKRVERM